MAGNFNETVKNWYAEDFSDDLIYEDFDPDVTLLDLMKWFTGGYRSDEDIYDIIFGGNGGDSIVRERVFEHLTELTGLDYDFFYCKWRDDEPKKLSFDEGFCDLLEALTK